jgi:hypothetical protein
VAEVTERLALSKQTAHIFHTERFNLKKLNEVEGKEQYRVEMSNNFPAFDNFDAEVDINRTWETIRERISEFQPEKHKPWFNEGCSKLCGTEMKWD